MRLRFDEAILGCRKFGVSSVFRASTNPHIIGIAAKPMSSSSRRAVTCCSHVVPRSCRIPRQAEGRGSPNE